MYLPTPTDLQPQARGFPGAQITDGVKQVTQVQEVTEATQVAPKVTEAAATVADKATEVASTVTDAATKAANTITSMGKDIKDKGQVSDLDFDFGRTVNSPS
jgi:methyl-accepting chemotaxis protein